MIKIARLDQPREQQRLIEAVLSGASVRDIREQIAATRGKGKGLQSPSAPKPKRVYRTAHRAMVIVQATGSQLSNQQCIDALREALDQANA
jgi:hypothetical protein